MSTSKLSRGRLVTAGALALSTALVLSACGSAGDQGVDSDGNITLTYRTWIPSVGQWQPIVEAFEKENSNIKIDFQGANEAGDYFGDLDNLILAGDVPDIYGIQVGSSFDDYAEYALPTSEYAEDWIGGLNSELLTPTTTSDGVVSAIPILTAGSEFYLYNETLFEELKLDLPTDYNSLLEVSKAAREAGVTAFAMGAADTWHAADFFIWLSNQYGTGDEIYQAAAGELPWDSPSLVAAAQMWQSLFQDGVFQDGATSTTTYPSARDDYFMARKALAMPTGSWHVSATLKDNPETPGTPVESDVLGMAAFPTLGDNPATTVTGVDYALALSADLEGDKLEAAAKFAEFMAVGTGQQIWVNTMQGFPAATSIAAEISEDETATALKSVADVTEAIQSATGQRKLVSANGGLENDLGIVLQNIANGADPAKELATIKSN